MGSLKVYASPIFIDVFEETELIIVLDYLYFRGKASVSEPSTCLGHCAS